VGFGAAGFLGAATFFFAAAFGLALLRATFRFAAFFLLGAALRVALRATFLRADFALDFTRALADFFDARFFFDAFFAFLAAMFRSPHSTRL